MSETLQQARERYQYIMALKEARFPGIGYQASPEPQSSPDYADDPEEEAYMNEPMDDPQATEQQHLEEPGNGNEDAHLVGFEHGQQGVPPESEDPEYMIGYKIGVHQGSKGIKEEDSMGPPPPMDPMQEACNKFMEGIKDEYATRQQAKTADEDNEGEQKDGADKGKAPVKPADIGMLKIKKFAEGLGQVGNAPTSQTISGAKAKFAEGLTELSKKK